MRSLQIAGRSWCLTTLAFLLGLVLAAPTAQAQQALEVSITFDGASKVLQNQIDFGQVVAGESLTGTVILTNNSTSDVLIDIAMIEGEVSDFFVEILPEGGAFLAPGDEYRSDVTFAPTMLGLQEDVLRYEYVLLQTEERFQIFYDLFGEGIIDVDGSTFPSVVIGESEARNFTLTNTSLQSGDDVLINLAAVEGELSDFFVEPIPEGGVILMPGEQYISEVTFTPTQADSVFEILRYDYIILNTETSTEVFYDLLGVGIPAVEANPSPVEFGEQEVGTASSTVLQVINNASDPRFVGSTEIIGPDANAFSLDPDLIEEEIPPISALQTDVVFRPQRLGLHEAILRIFVSDSFVPVLEVPLSGLAIEGQNPVLSLSPLQINFDATDIGQDRLAPLTVSNTGNADLEVTNIRVAGGNAQDFAVLGETSFILPPEGQRVVDVQFAPTARGQRSATLEVLSNAGIGQVPLSGTGRAPLADVPPALSFGEVPVGNARSRTFLISNRGDGPLTVGDLLIVGSPAFAVTGGAPVPTIPAGGSHELEVTFTPDAAGLASATLQLPTNDPVRPLVEVALQGEGTEALTQSAQALGFGDVRVGQSATLDVVVSNTSGAPVTLSAGAIDAGTDFSVSPSGEQVLQGGASQRYQVTFSPQSRGEQTAVLSFPTNLAAPSEVTVDLSGRGIAPVLGVSPPEVAFGTVPVGFATEQGLTLSNDGDAPLTIERVTLSDADGPFALLSDGSGGTLDPGGSIDLTVEFMPSQSGSASADLRIVSDDPQAPTRSVPLSGTGAALTDETAPEAPIGTSATVRLSVPDEFSPSSATVFYRRAGEPNYQSAPLSETGRAAKTAATLTAQIPAAFVTERGVQYYFALSDGEQTVTVPMQNPAAQPRQIRVTFDGLDAPVALAAEQYGQFTLPVAFPQPPSLAGLFEDDFGPYDPDVWRLLRWNTAEEQYREVPNLNEQYRVGKGFWMIAAEAQSFDVGAGRSVDASGPVVITLPPGHSQIGTPFAFPVAWSDVEIDGDAAAVEAPVAFDGQEYVPGQDILQPWTGYFVYNGSGAPVTLRIPPREAGGAARGQATASFAERQAAEGAFVVQLRAEVPSRGWRDTQNYLVLQSDAAPVVQRWAEPPPINPSFRLSIVEQDRSYLALARTAGTSAQGQHWDVELRAAPAPELRRQRWPVTLTATTAGERPAGYRLVLLDRDEGRILEPSGDAWTVTLDAQRPVRRLRVTLGTEAYMADVTAPFQEPTLAAGYPNPFTDATRLSYRVPEARAVRIQVFDLLGRKVRTLIDGDVAAGQHTVTWDGRDDTGRRVASGTYLCRMQAGDRVMVQSLVVAR